MVNYDALLCMDLFKLVAGGGHISVCKQMSTLEKLETKLPQEHGVTREGACTAMLKSPKMKTK